jgi:AbrB family looped-hinge helix DNA binding protein
MLVENLEQVERYTVQVRQRGQLTIPQKVRESLGIEDGDTMTLVKIGGHLFLSPKGLYGPDLGDQFIKLMDQEGITLADLLEDLPQIRKEIFRERYQTDS